MATVIQLQNLIVNTDSSVTRVRGRCECICEWLKTMTERLIQRL